jgi:AcrR family transcriptional regulator
MDRAHKDLSGKQEMALELVICGMNDGDIAKRAGVSRQTINTWRNHDEDFRMLLAERRVALHEQYLGELNGLVSEAISVMRDAIRKGDLLTRLWAAHAVLRMLGLQSAVPTQKQPSGEEIINEFLSDMIRKVAQEVGIYNPKRLPGEES